MFERSRSSAFSLSATSASFNIFQNSCPAPSGSNHERGKALVKAIIKNTYRTLMTRGMKGCYVYFTDKGTAEYFRNKLKQI